METGWVLSAYWVCLMVGIAYTVISLLLGGGHGTHLDGGGHGGDLGAGGHDSLQGNIDTGQVLFGPFSPLVIAFFLTCFGATGVLLTPIFKQFITLPAATSSGFILAWLLITFFNKFLGAMQSSSEVKLYTLIGYEGEVTVQIPSDGIGEIAYVAMGSRYVAPARSEEHIVIPRFAGVRITRLVGSMFYVRPLVEEQLRHIDTTPVETVKSAQQD